MSANSPGIIPQESQTPESKNPRGIHFEPAFSTPGSNPFDEVEWSYRDIAIRGDDGKALFEQKSAEIPKNWSELAAKIAVSKYFYGDPANGTNPAAGGREQSIKEVIHRVTRTITDWGIEDKYFDSDESANAFYNDLTWLCLNQHAAFNSPVWFNVGLYQQYKVGDRPGEKKSAGNWHWRDDLGEAARAESQYIHPQASACFIQSVRDTMEDIMRLATAEAMLFKYGSGSGSDLSTLRSSREKLSGGGKPSGPLSFLRIYDQVAAAIKSGGKTRRAAKMNTLKGDHPDIEEFIEAKTIEEKKAWALIEQGYDGSYNGDAYGSVMFQNENLTVRVSDEFMEAAIENKPWWTITVSDQKPCEEKNARDLLYKIALGTHTCGDPGMQFDTTIHEWHTCKGTARQHSTNPCSEFLFLNDTACNLASINLIKFKTKAGTFDVERFRKAIALLIVAQEILVDRASYPTKEIAENSHAFRPLGLGYANLGALIMSLGLGYDSREGREYASAITALMTGESYHISSQLAAVKGAFDGFHTAAVGSYKETLEDSNKEAMLEVIGKHLAKCEMFLKNVESEDHAVIFRTARTCWQDALAQGEIHGYRNSQVTVLAPTGTIGFLMDCDTTGIEPDLALVKYKVLAGGGTLKIVNSTVAPALRKLGYNDEDTIRILQHIEKYDTIENVTDPTTGTTVNSGIREEHISIFDCAFKAHLGQRSLGYMGHLRMMAAAQPFLSGAISKTVNLPENATVEEIMETYIEAWKLGLKAVAIYRDGSKRSAPLNTKLDKTTSDVDTNKDGTISQAELDALMQPLKAQIEALQTETVALKQRVKDRERVHMPETRNSLTHKFTIAGHEGYLTVGMLPTGKPGELFIQMSKEGSTIGGLMDTVATLTSVALQYNVPLEQLVNKFAFQRFEPSGYTDNPNIRTAFSITDYVFRWLGCQFIPGYKKATGPGEHGEQEELPMPEIEQMDKAAVNRPVPELAVNPQAPEAKADLLTNIPAIAKTTDQDAVKTAMGNAYMGITCGVCGSDKVIRAGACGVCTECGTSQGCS
jgi:ribonucleoside-diphosphate reductase alpha chain